ncbi:MAG: hypothetical protein CMD88_01825 [Gammaproteobacteria bacterium]|nr:hypothetical protein [Gammaproteobacteria bacterium]|tara:strand:+ start:7131 stop:7826 length:696 start_codon:yes stop_codon:yes gene_type:complete
MLNDNQADFIFIKWVYFVVILLIAISILHQVGFIKDLFISDISYISSLILFLFIIFTIKVGLTLYHIKNTNKYLSSLLTNTTIEDLENLQKTSDIPDNFFNKCITKHLINSLNHTDDTTDELNKIFEFKITKPLEIGWLMSDLLLKLGLIGTVIGFIIMLNSVTLIENFDLTMMQDLLKQMSGGMKVALYTTLTGLITSILLSTQYKYLEEKIYDIVCITNENIELYLKND